MTTEKQIAAKGRTVESNSNHALVELEPDPLQVEDKSAHQENGFVSPKARVDRIQCKPPGPDGLPAVHSCLSGCRIQRLDASTHRGSHAVLAMVAGLGPNPQAAENTSADQGNGFVSSTARVGPAPRKSAGRDTVSGRNEHATSAARSHPPRPMPSVYRA